MCSCCRVSQCQTYGLLEGQSTAITFTWSELRSTGSDCTDWQAGTSPHSLPKCSSTRFVSYRGRSAETNGANITAHNALAMMVVMRLEDMRGSCKELRKALFDL